MELQERIVQEAQRLHHTEQDSLTMDAMCCIEFASAQTNPATKKRRAHAYISQAAGGMCVLLVGEKQDVVVQCTVGALGALVADWSQLVFGEDVTPVLILHKASGWDKQRVRFMRLSKLLEVRLIVDEDSGLVSAAELLAVLQRFTKFVRALRPSVRSPFQAKT